MGTKIADTVDSMKSNRSCGEIHFAENQIDEFMADDIIVALDQFVEIHGFQPIETGWREVDRDFASRTMIWSLSHDLAYGAQLMADTKATEVADAYMGHFCELARFFTNYCALNDECAVLEKHLSYSASRLSASTFDIGVAVIDQKSITLLLFSDED